MDEGAYLRLDALLGGHGRLWRPQPFKEARPDWCFEFPALAEYLLGLDTDAVTSLTGDNQGLTQLLVRFLPELAEVGELTALPGLRDGDAMVLDKPRSLHLNWEIPGRKAGQIRAFAEALGAVGHPVLEWCGGKGHLGRLLSAGWGVPVETVDHDGGLCEDGAALARRAGVAQSFRQADALHPETLMGVSGRHAVALHACGDLHVQLVRSARQSGLAALDVAPCCYNRTVREPSMALAGGRLVLSRDDLRLAVSDTVTVAARELRLRQKESAWKLGFVAWRARETGGPYRTFKPVPDIWLKDGFGEFCRRLAAREGLAPPHGDLAEFEKEGWRRSREVDRLNLVRLGFRRPLEVWLAQDRALCLQGQGYAVRVGEFCPRQLTPRNILISAR